MIWKGPRADPGSRKAGVSTLSAGIGSENGDSGGSVGPPPPLDSGFTAVPRSGSAALRPRALSRRQGLAGRSRTSSSRAESDANLEPGRWLA
jgi:hypothetical protein